MRCAVESGSSVVDALRMHAMGTRRIAALATEAAAPADAPALQLNEPCGAEGLAEIRQVRLDAGRHAGRLSSCSARVLASLRACLPAWAA